MFLITFIIIIYIFYHIYTIQNTSQNKINNLGFSKIVMLSNTSSYSIYSAIKNGDNYIILTTKNAVPITKDLVISLVDMATKMHYHNMVIIPNKETISNSAKQEINKYNIQIIYNLSNNTVTPQKPINTKHLDDNCTIDTPEDPIQDGKRVNSLLGNFFGNKIEKL